MTAATTTRLHVCVLCDGELCYPVRWDASDYREPVSMILRCPECQFRRGVIVSRDECEAFEDVLNAGTDAMIDALESMERTHAMEDLQTMVAALDADAVTAFDIGGAL